MSATPAATPTKPLSAEEQDAFARRIVEEMRAGRPDVVNAFIDWPELYARATSGLVLPDTARKGFLEGVPERTLFDPLIAETRAGGTFSFVHALRASGGGSHRGARLLFRQISADGGFDYVELSVEKTGIGAAVTDFYALGVGESISDTLRAELAPLAAPSSHWTSVDRGVVEHAAAIDAFRDLVLAKKHAEALTAYAKLAAAAKAQKGVQQLRLAAARGTSPEAFSAALDELTLRFPDDPSAHAQALAAALEAGDFDAALTAVNALDRSVETDPYLEVQRSNVRAAAGDLVGANELARSAAQKLDTVHGCLTLIATSLRIERHDDTLFALAKLLQSHHFDFGDVKSEPDFHAFRKSRAYDSWIEMRKNRP